MLDYLSGDMGENKLKNILSIELKRLADGLDVGRKEAGRLPGVYMGKLD